LSIIFQETKKIYHSESLKNLAVLSSPLYPEWKLGKPARGFGTLTPSASCIIAV